MSSVSQKNPIRLFVCHVWIEDDDYLRVFEYLESTENFFYLNTSTPDKRPPGDKEALRDDLRRQITEAELVIVAASFYRRYMDWAEFQLNCAKAFDKPVVVLEPFGSHDTIAPAVMEMGDEVVPWDKRQIVDAIKRQARHEETTRFDVIEFKLD
ncbi:MAG: TIR domain-containing protein [Steroidobacteraceae bacterium]|nr:TIR domain-containing protein [Steroidobacteraceae bacterium]